VVRFYLDIETYRPRSEDAFIDERILSIGLIIDETPYQESSLDEDIEPILISEWDGLDERSIVLTLYNQVRKALESYRFTILCGFNILRFDIPLLTCKLVYHSIDKHEKIAKMWFDCYIIDHFQQLLAANRNVFKGVSLKKIIDVSEKFDLKPPKYSTSGSDIKELYDHENYDEIEEHLNQDLRIIRWLDLYGARRLIERSIREEHPIFFEEGKSNLDVGIIFDGY
jgi:hypothetical protein